MPAYNDMMERDLIAGSADAGAKAAIALPRTC